MKISWTNDRLRNWNWLRTTLSEPATFKPKPDPYCDEDEQIPGFSRGVCEDPVDAPSTSKPRKKF